MKYNLKPDERATLELRGLYEKYGYKKYKIGKFEEYSLYAANRDFIAGDKVLTFTDLDGRLLAMKPDVTLSVVNNTRATRSKSEKLYYIENVYRENKESHAFKEISQMGLEYLGHINRHSILEVIVLAAKTLKTIDSDYLLEISHMHYTVHLLEALQLGESVYLEILNNIRQKNVTGITQAASRAGLDSKTTEILCQIPFLYGEMSKTIKKAKTMALNDEMLQDIDELQEYCSALRSLGYSKNLQLDLSMVNDIDYYNGIVFRGYIRGLPGCVLSGGQYDKAMKLLGKDAGGVGFAVYLDELLKGTQHPSKYDVDAVLLYSEDEPLTSVIRAEAVLQKEGLSVRTETSIPDCLRYREKYVMKDGKPVKEDETC
ncbi:MAG: ATP phosphoribosyltransferase regulatory subunit [Bacillota bacterium]|nr:ATP phosphoribosyltransferase regulatory subunit [Bacillota bacterium]